MPEHVRPPNQGTGSDRPTQLRHGRAGTWLRARDVRLKRDVAIKVLPLAMAYDASRIARFEREARAANAPSYANINDLSTISAATTAPAGSPPS